ncbi:helix-turn-helix transcriptional regulator [Pseudomonas putida]|uniref:helix-turn-helix transcriptional regulator n=1 Tax=Pseudomonas putida TaxID=303 RepID=UPI00295EEA50|nr:helix-turn-helix transcriptional regulator [Pseudomonas putida]
MSSRTYLSSLERGLKSLTLEKINQLAGALKVHPLTILVATYIGRDADSTTLGHPAHAHLDTRSTSTWTPDPRPLGQAVGAQRRRVALLV